MNRQPHANIDDGPSEICQQPHKGPVPGGSLVSGKGGGLKLGRRARSGAPWLVVPSLLLWTGGVIAQVVPAPVAMPEMVVTGTLFGSEMAALEIPGSAAYVGPEAIDRYTEVDVNRALRQIPGVYVREEDGYGNFPNISLRGVTTVRNTKITVMEDGILSAPAPYSDPAAYYTPAMGRMHALEVIKGSSQIRYGPHITGGVLNYLSTPIPGGRHTRLKAYYGSHNEVFALGNHGATVDVGPGRFGYVLEGFYHQSDGFKTIDGAPGVDRDRTGFERIEPMVKLAYDLSGEVEQRFEVKYGYTDFEADETYLGLTEDDFARDPYRRYSATRFDHIPTEHHRTYLRHVIRPTEAFAVTTTGYYNHFDRAWYKLNNVRLAGDSTWRNLSETLAGAHGDLNALGVLRGTEAGQLRYRNNNRSYEAWGIEQQYRYEFSTGSVEHRLDGGIRYHEDEASRFQNDTVYNQDATGAFVGQPQVGAPGSQDNRSQDSQAWAFHLQDTIEWNRWSISPGLRYEHIDYSQINYNATTPQRQEGDLDVLGGGFGVIYQVSDPLSLITGVHHGFSVPGPGGAISNGLEEETSWSTEAGARYVSEKYWKLEGIYFFTAFSDLIVDSNSGGGGGGVTENAGDVNVHGVELAAGWDPGRAGDWGLGVPLSVAFTYTDARFDGDASNNTAESIFSGAEDGNRVPYIPEFQINAQVGIEYDRYSTYLQGTYVPRTYATGSNTSEQVRPDGTPDARYGETDAYFLLEWTFGVRLSDHARLFGGIRNVIDEEYVASRIPEGPRPGMPQTFYGGLEINF